MPDVIKDVGHFLGKSLPDDVIDDVIQHLTFYNMTHNDMVNYENIPQLDTKISPFLRRGIIGDWKNYFSENQVRHVDKSYKDITESFYATCPNDDDDVD